MTLPADLIPLLTGPPRAAVHLAVHHHFRLDHLRSYLRRVDIPVIAVIESVIGAACYAASSVLQQRAASEQPDDISMKPGLLLRLLRSGRWMLGNLLDVGGYVFQFLALRKAALALVEPLFVIGLLFAIVGSALLDRRWPTAAEWRSSGLVVVGLALFIAAARPGPGHPRASAGGWIALFVITAVFVGAATVVARQVAAWRAGLLGAATGIIFGVTSAVTEHTGHVLDGGVLHTLANWAPYVLVALSLFGLLLNQSAYQAGDLALSLPVMTALEPIVAILIGQFLFGEHIHTAALPLTGVIVGLVIMTVGIIELGRLEAPKAGATSSAGPELPEPG